jgi:hypothetical protein
MQPTGHMLGTSSLLSKSEYVRLCVQLLHTIIILTIYQCYDMRFPELSLTLAQMGADILTFPSAFTYVTGSAHWETILRARAIESQCYVIAAAQTGVHNSKRTSWGHGMVCIAQKQQFFVPHTTCKTEIPAFLDNWLTNTPSVKTLCPQKLVLLIFS